MKFDELLASLESASPIRKANPTVTDAHVNVPLNNIVIAYMQSATMIADKLFPVVGVAKQSDLYYKYDLDTFYRDDAKPRAPSSESAGGGFKFTTDNYSCVVEAYHKDIDDQLRANADSVLQLDRAAAEFVAQKLVLRRESRFISTYFKAGVWGTDLTGTPTGAGAGEFKQFDAVDSDPRVVIEAAKLQMLRTSGYEPNVALFGAEVMSKLLTNKAVREQFKYTSAESINEAMIARYMGLDNVYVSKSVSAQGPEGPAPVIDLQAANHILLAYRAPAPSILAPSAGYTFSWTALGGLGIQTTRMRAPLITSDRIEGQMAYDYKVVAPLLGTMLLNAVT